VAQGLQIFNAAGQTVMDTNNRVGRVLGVINVTANQFSHFQIPLAAGEVGWFSAMSAPPMSLTVFWSTLDGLQFSDGHEGYFAIQEGAANNVSDGRTGLCQIIYGVC
jgi:hypothetical protein